MGRQGDAKELREHFAFGENWRSFAAGIDEERVQQATRDLQRLVELESLRDASFLDIGCGSGLSSLAALNCGVRSVFAVDIDPVSVETTKNLLSGKAPGKDWKVEVRSVFDLREQDGLFDVVYSWGVLHHTGDMFGAVRQATRLVRPGGLLALALYQKTPACGFWRCEKRLYAHGPRWFPPLARAVYKPLVLLARCMVGQSPLKYIREYRSSRGMDWHHDIHDWLGGYPYQSVSVRELEEFLITEGFEKTRSFLKNIRLWGALGSGCDEYVFRHSTGAGSRDVAA